MSTTPPVPAAPVPAAPVLTAPSRTIPPRALLLLAVLTLIWGTNWALFPLAVREISVWTFRSVSVFGAGVVLLGVARLRGQSLVVPRRYWAPVALATCFYLVLWNIASTYAALMIPSGQAAVLASRCRCGPRCSAGSVDSSDWARGCCWPWRWARRRWAC